MDVIANIIGIFAVITFCLSYQLKTRRNLILCNAASRVLYVLQYILLGAFEGALLDVVALLVSLIYKRSASFGKGRLAITVVLSNIAVVGLGMITYKNIFSLLPILGVIFETLALVPKSERKIRAMSLLGAPFWLAYNLICGAYGSSVGNVITLVTIFVAIIRFDILKKQKEMPI